MTRPARRRAGAALSARARLERLLYTSVGVATIAYTATLLPGAGGIKRQTPQLDGWYGYGLIGVALVLPIVVGIAAWVLPRRVVRPLAIGTALLFLVAMMLFPVGLPAPLLDGDANPWFQGIHALHGMILATALQRRWVWLYGVAQGVIIGVVQVNVREDAVKSASLTGLNAFVYMTILTAVAFAVMSAADRLDAAAAAARSQAADNAARRTHEREEGRIDAIVHDDIMSVLLTASREQPPASLGDQAKRALASIDLLDDPEALAREYSTAETVQVLREPIERIVPTASAAVTGEQDYLVPAVVVTALHDALAEALRNSVRHAGAPGEEVARSVRIDVAADGITVVARDEGKGFAVRAVKSRRLGMRLSIVERMSLVPGGGADIQSKQGAGTTVTLTWKRDQS